MAIDFQQFGLNVKTAREVAGLSQAQVAERIGKSVAHVSAVECGRMNVSLAAISSIADACEITPSLLLEPNVDR